jgi:hypothetical protein
VHRFEIVSQRYVKYLYKVRNDFPRVLEETLVTPGSKFTRRIRLDFRRKGTYTMDMVKVCERGTSIMEQSNFPVQRQLRTLAAFNEMSSKSSWKQQ